MYVRNGELNFTPDQLVAFQSLVQIAVAEASDMEAVGRIMSNGYSFGPEGDEAAKKDLLPYAPVDDIAVVHFDSMPKVECDIVLPRLRYVPIHTHLAAVSVKEPTAIIEGVVRTKTPDKDNEDERRFAAIVSTQESSQKIRALLAPAFLAGYDESYKDPLVDPLVDQLREANRQARRGLSEAF